MCENELNEPEFSTMNKITQSSQHLKDYSQIGIEYISQYSHFLEREKKVKDITSVHSKTMERDDYSLYNNFNISSNQEMDKIISTDLSPGVQANLNKNLCTIEKLDYNIFELNELVETQSLTILSLEIFKKLDFFNKKLLSEEGVKRFVDKVTKGYDRNVTYHNDLHAADVLQTSFAIIRNSETLKVIPLFIRNYSY